MLEIENDVKSIKVIAANILELLERMEKKLLYSALTATVLPFFPLPGLIQAGIDLRKLRLATETATIV